MYALNSFHRLIHLVISGRATSTRLIVICLYPEDGMEELSNLTETRNIFLQYVRIIEVLRGQRRRDHMPDEHETCTVRYSAYSSRNANVYRALP